MNHSKNRIFHIIFGMAGVILLTCLDQFSKYLAVVYLKDKPSLELIPDVFELCYLENRGAAWGLFENMQWLFLIFTAVIAAAVVFYYVKSIPYKKYTLFRILSIVLISGAMGNAIDRVVHGYVIDFFYFKIIDFPVFNVADCYVTISIALFLLIYRKEVAEWIRSE